MAGKLRVAGLTKGNTEAIRQVTSTDTIRSWTHNLALEALSSDGNSQHTYTPHNEAPGRYDTPSANPVEDSNEPPYSSRRKSRG